MSALHVIFKVAGSEYALPAGAPNGAYWPYVTVDGHQMNNRDRFAEAQRD